MRLLLPCLALLAAAPLHASDWTWTYQDDTRAVAHAIADDGATYLVGNSAAANTHFVTRLEPDGSVAWRREHAGVWTQGSTATLELGSDRACLYGGDARDAALMQPQYAACYELEDGDLLRRFAFDELRLGGTRPDQSYSLLLADGGFVSLTARASAAEGSTARTVRHRRFAADGTVLHDVVLGEQGFRHVDGRRADGTILYQTDLFFREYRAIDANGATPFALDDDALDVVRAQFAPDGTIHVAGSRLANQSFARWQLDAAGRELSRASIEYAPVFGSIVGFSADFTFDRAQVFLTAAFVVDDNFPPAPKTVLSVSRLTAPTFEILNTIPPGSFRVDPATNALLSVSDQRFRIGVDALDLTGRRLRTRFLSGCATCSVARLHVSDDGTLRAVVRTSSDAASAGLRVHALADAWAPRAPTRVDQRGLRGAWYSPYLPGNGIVIDYLPGTNTLFVPRFTQNGPASSLRWESLQGTAPENGTRATLQIFENTGGAFASAPDTFPRGVGTATLEAYDCDSATLEIGTGELRSTISLSRLTPATEPCVLADGTTRGSTAAARGGFDARQSGTWFSPARSGQGLSFAVQPGGLFFGAWFTYDPRFGADDPTAQHWFTLQGDLAAATDGRVTLPIFRTTGVQVGAGAATTTVAVGTATITFTACDRATLDYAFDDTDAAANFRRLSGTLALEKIGGCAN